MDELMWYRGKSSGTLSVVCREPQLQLLSTKRPILLYTSHCVHNRSGKWDCQGTQRRENWFWRCGQEKPPSPHCGHRCSFPGWLMWWFSLPCSLLILLWAAVWWAGGCPMLNGKAATQLFHPWVSVSTAPASSHLSLRGWCVGGRHIKN